MKNREEEETYLQNMIDSYARVHNTRYWTEVQPFLIDDARVLDIGCGPGLLLKDLADKVQVQYIYALDLSKLMLEQVNLNLSSYSDRLQTIQQHMQENVSLPDNLDMVFSSRVLRSFENIWDVIRNIHRSLKPGGVFILLDWSQASLNEYHEYFKNSGNYDLDMDSVIRKHRNFSRYGLNDYKYMLEQAKFEVLHSFQVRSTHHCVIARKN
ncbi:MAG: methyltransferase domain-containing protein [Candidatus Heimdallarchaeota archaeon]|nr:methyltransferase domain-containing protein [Candidatus Heimdallarchaeota archaeon]